MKLSKKLIALTAVAGLSVLGAACDADTEVESPGVEEPAEDVIVEDEGEGTDVTVEGDTTEEAPEGDTTVEGDTTEEAPEAEAESTEG